VPNITPISPTRLAARRSPAVRHSFRWVLLDLCEVLLGVAENRVPILLEREGDIRAVHPAGNKPLGLFLV
jgi:hypothetical protein